MSPKEAMTLIFVSIAFIFAIVIVADARSMASSDDIFTKILGSFGLIGAVSVAGAIIVAALYVLMKMWEKK